MKKSNAGWFVACFMLLVIAGSCEKDIHSGSLTEEEFKDQLDDRIPVWLERYEVPGVSIAFVRNGELTWADAYGLADIDDQIRMTPETICRVESISKSVTARGVMKLVEMGEISLDDPVHKHLVSWRFPESDVETDKVTIRQLLSHTSGLALGTLGLEYSPQEEKPSLRESLTRDVTFIREPGKSFSYSNVGFNLLELLIEDVSGRDFSDFMKEEILTPLGMVNADFEWREEFPTPVPDGHKLSGEPVPVYVYSVKGAGGLFANAEDIAVFAATGMLNPMYAKDDVLSQRSLREIYTPVTEVDQVYSFVADYYGLGHFIEILPNGKRAVFGGGQGNGWMTHFHLVPETGDGIVILTNSSRSWPLISHILSDWAEWSGYGSVGMGIIAKAMSGFRILIFIILSGALLQLWRLIRGYKRGGRRVELKIRDFSVGQFLQIALVVILAAVVIWSATREYLFIRSVFPGASDWFFGAIVFLALVIFVSALIPKRGNTRGSTEPANRP